MSDCCFWRPFIWPLVTILTGFLLLFVVGGGKIILAEEETMNELEVDIEQLHDLSAAKNSFALKLFPGIVEEENLFISPYSVHTALTLAYLGAGGQTREELRQALELADLDEQLIKQQTLALKNHLEQLSDETEVSIANALFLKQSVEFLESYKQAGRRYFAAELNQLPPTGETINQWVAEQTNDLITQVISPEPIPEEIVAYLVNAIYFKALWEKEFDPDNTRERPFYGPEETAVEMMQNRARYRYGITEKIKTLSLEYKDRKFLFNAFMPVAPDYDLEEFYQEVDAQTLTTARENMREGEIILRLPKFTMEKDIALAEILRQLGISRAFDRQAADFSRMVDLPTLEPLNLFLNQVYHSSFVELDEKGTEAAAATAVEMGVTSLPPEPPVIEFNKPFFFTIEAAQTGTILFMGQFLG